MSSISVSVSQFIIIVVAIVIKMNNRPLQPNLADSYQPYNTKWQSNGIIFKGFQKSGRKKRPKTL